MTSNTEPLLPPGFRFHPTDEELVLHYLAKQTSSLPCPVSIIAEVDIYKFDPWDLPAKASFGDREWYFFSPRGRKYPNGVRPNRAAASGYWKATGTDKPVVKSSGPGKETVGMKKALVFYRGKPPKGIKTKWIMHEYRLAENGDATRNQNRPAAVNHRDSTRLDEWVLCRIYNKHSSPPNGGVCDGYTFNTPYFSPGHADSGPSGSDVRLWEPSALSQLLDDPDYSLLSSMLDENPPSDAACSKLNRHQSNSNQLSLLHGSGNIGPSGSDATLSKSSSSQLLDGTDYSLLSGMLYDNRQWDIAYSELSCHQSNMNQLSLLHGGGSNDDNVSFSPLEMTASMKSFSSLPGRCHKRQRTRAHYQEDLGNPSHLLGSSSTRCDVPGQCQYFAHQADAVEFLHGASLSLAGVGKTKDN